MPSTRTRIRRPSEYRHAAVASGRVITTILGVLIALVAAAVLSRFVAAPIAFGVAIFIVVAGIALALFQAERD